MLTGSSPLARYAIAAGAAPVENDIIALNAAGTAVAATDAAAIKVVGVCAGLLLVDDVATEVEVRDGIVALDNSADAAALARTDRGRPVYVADKDTVSKLPGTHGVVAGLLVDIDDDGVYVDMSPHALAAAAALAVQDANIAAFVADPAAAAALTYADPAALTSPTVGTGAGADATTFSGAQCDALRADVAAIRTALVAAGVDLGALRTAVGANNTAITDSLAHLQAAALMAAE